MGTLGDYKIDVKNMRTDEQHYSFVADNAFFSVIGATEIQRGNVQVELCVRHRGGAYQFDFSLQGIVQIPCDRCLDDMDLPIDIERSLRVKMGEEYMDEGDLIVIPESEGVLDVAWFVYEFMALEIPIKHTHAPGQCNADMLNALSKHLAIVDDGDETIDAEDEGDGDMATLTESDTAYGGEGVADVRQGQAERPIDPRWNALKKIIDNN